MIYVSGIYAGYGTGFYSNIRTYFNIALSASIDYHSYTEIFRDGEPVIVMPLSSQGYYYISERLRVGYIGGCTEALCDIFDKDSSDPKDLNINCNLTFRYAVFEHTIFSIRNYIFNLPACLFVTGLSPYFNINFPDCANITLFIFYVALA